MVRDRQVKLSLPFLYDHDRGDNGVVPALRVKTGAIAPAPLDELLARRDRPEDTVREADVRIVEGVRKALVVLCAERVDERMGRCDRGLGRIRHSSRSFLVGTSRMRVWPAPDGGGDARAAPWFVLGVTQVAGSSNAPAALCG